MTALGIDLVMVVLWVAGMFWILRFLRFSDNDEDDKNGN
jgi:hypothetical protein